MRERRIIGIAVLLSVLLSVSLAFGLGFVDISKLPFVNTSPPAGGGPGPTVSVSPDTIIKDYLLDPGYQIGDKFTVDVNIADVADLYTWQLNVTWDPSILSASDYVAGGFLLGTISPDKTAAFQLGYVINATDNANGYTCISESILGEYAGITGSGQLATIEFEVVGYGYTNLTISTSGDMPTTLLDSPGNSIGFSVGNGWFDNRLTGDANGDKIVTLADIGEVSSRWTSPPGLLPYARYVDMDDNGVISLGDIGVVSANWGRFVP